LWSFPLVPPQASTLAGRVDQLLVAWLVLAGGVSLAVVALVVGFGIRYRRNSSAKRERRVAPVRAIEYTWTLVPLGLFIAMFGWAAWLFYQQYNPPPRALTIYAVGKMWMWKLQQPGGQRELNQLHVPAGQPVKVVLTSEDAIHSFYVPAFRIKQDAFPGRYTALWFQATIPGRYHLYCAEYCGFDHARMAGTVTVMAPADYQAWLAGGRGEPSLAARGQALFTRFGCAGCHGSASVVRAPDLTGIYGRPQPLQGGQFVTADETYLQDSILFPHKQIVAGYADKMPSFRGQIGQDDMVALIAYLKSLSDERNPL
jgi:cytochrome c oxidase subunit 2